MTRQWRKKYQSTKSSVVYKKELENGSYEFYRQLICSITFEVIVIMMARVEEASQSPWLRDDYKHLEYTCIQDVVLAYMIENSMNGITLLTTASRKDGNDQIIIGKIGDAYPTVSAMGYHGKAIRRALEVDEDIRLLKSETEHNFSHVEHGTDYLNYFNEEHQRALILLGQEYLKNPHKTHLWKYQRFALAADLSL